MAFAHETNDARRELAVKFFFTPAAFTTETNIVQVEVRCYAQCSRRRRRRRRRPQCSTPSVTGTV